MFGKDHHAGMADEGSIPHLEACIDVGQDPSNLQLAGLDAVAQLRRQGAITVSVGAAKVVNGGLGHSDAEWADMLRTIPDARRRI